MDAEFFSRAGANVTSADISSGAASRARERSLRQAVPFDGVVADATHLPFADRSFDIVYVHDGLHHLEDPFVGLAEMTRVARHAVSVTEPARAAATGLALKFGLAEDSEEAGNRVARLDLREVEVAVERAGFRVVKGERYAMFYRHEPGWGMHLCSSRAASWLTRASFRGANALLGRFGNKLVVIAVREEQPE